MAEPLLVGRELRKSYGEHVAVDGVSFAIPAGTAYGLLGPNGAGKTTTISMLCGLLRPDGGTVTVAGVDLDREPAAAKSRIGLVPQELAIYPDLTARENLAFFGRLYGLRGPRLRARIDAALELVDLTSRAADRASTYSGGMKRRLNIAAGLLHEPQLLVLDEPTVGVDPQSRAAILDRIAELKAGGTTLLYSSHYMEEVEKLCDRVGIVDHGQLIAEGTHRELRDSLGTSDRVDLGIDGDARAVAGLLAGLAGVEHATATSESVTVLAADGRALLAALVTEVDRGGAAVTSFEVHEPDLEAVFLQLTGRALRD